MATVESKDSFGVRSKLQVGNKTWDFFNLGKLGRTRPEVDKLPFSLKVLLENLLRHEDGRIVTRDHVEALLAWDPKKDPETEISFHPARVLMQDFTGVPAVVDLAAMREATLRMGGDPNRINPLHPADLVIDHSVQVDRFATSSAFEDNVKLEFERNHERYVFLRWGQQAFERFGVVPPGTGICHQVNLEYLAQGVFRGENQVAYPDTLVGTDSHTTMVNGLGVVGWGVGGIEAEAALLGQPITMLIPQVVGFKLEGKLPEGATATDLVLTVTQMLRKHGVVSKFVEFYGPGISALSLPDRATISNMAPEYGATIGFFPVDEETLSYLRFTGRTDEQVELVEKYCREVGLFHDKHSPEPSFSASLALDLSTVEPCISGPRRPQDRITLRESKVAFRTALASTVEAGRLGNEKVAEWIARGGAPGSAPRELMDGELGKLAARTPVSQGNVSFELGHGAVVIAAITSCTNTSNPAVLLAAGLLAKKAVELGLSTQPWVKTSLAPGSQVVADYLADAGVTPYLEALGFHITGYGCTTCIGNSGPLPEHIAEAVVSGDLSVAAVLSGNRNFEGRINQHVKMNYLASPPLVVAYALAGTMDIDLNGEPLGHDRNGQPVFLKELWPTQAEINAAVRTHVKAEQFRARYSRVLEGDAHWQKLPTVKGAMFEWDEKSTYVRKPPFFDDIPKEPRALTDIAGARVLAVLGDSVTTDHISPAGNIAKSSPAAKYLIEHGVEPKDFNSYGARRGNHEVMMRGTFANIRLRNLLVPGVEGGVTVHLPTGEKMSIFDASMLYQKQGTPLVILAGAEYGTGSSRDWAAKGTMLLGVKAVIAKSFERIHRSNLVGMGVLPLQFEAGQDASSLGLTGQETFDIDGISKDLAPGKKLQVVAKAEGGEKKFTAICRIDTPNELDYYRHGGILHYVLRQLAKA
jgi:aconitate hydratase